MNNEPVAWMDKKTGQVSRVACYDIPLYTHPAKTLTDEEIDEIADKELKYQIEGSSASGVYKFARAILKKASEI